MEPMGSVVIGPQQIYDQLVLNTNAVNKLTAQLDRLTDGHAEIKSDVTDHEVRIRALEARRIPLPIVPAISLVVAIGSLGAAAVALVR